MNSCTMSESLTVPAKVTAAEASLFRVSSASGSYGIGLNDGMISVLWNGRKSLSVDEIMNLSIPFQNRACLVLRTEVLPVATLFKFARRVSARAIYQIKTSGCEVPKDIVKVQERWSDWIEGLISNDEMKASIDGARGYAVNGSDQALRNVAGAVLGCYTSDGTSWLSPQWAALGASGNGLQVVWELGKQAGLTVPQIEKDLEKERDAQAQDILDLAFLAAELARPLCDPEEQALRPLKGEGDSLYAANQPCEPRPLGGPGGFQQQLPGLTGD